MVLSTAVGLVIRVRSHSNSICISQEKTRQTNGAGLNRALTGVNVASGFSS
jgi:hypothetical protein